MHLEQWILHLYRGLNWMTLEPLPTVLYEKPHTHSLLPFSVLLMLECLLVAGLRPTHCDVGIQVASLRADSPPPWDQKRAHGLVQCWKTPWIREAQQPNSEEEHWLYLWTLFLQLESLHGAWKHTYLQYWSQRTFQGQEAPQDQTTPWTTKHLRGRNQVSAWHWQPMGQKVWTWPWSHPLIALLTGIPRAAGTRRRPPKKDQWDVQEERTCPIPLWLQLMYWGDCEPKINP